MTNLLKERKRAQGKSVSAPVKSELSRQLCEICGIEPEIIEDYDSNEYEIYPDFSQSGNLVKLLKIANDVLGCVHFATAYTKNKPDIFEEQVLLHYLPIAKLNEGFKRAIRAEEWKYENVDFGNTFNLIEEVNNEHT